MTTNLKKIICLLAACAFFVAASELQPEINNLRRDAKLTFEEPLQGVPPLLVMTTTVFGCFRGIIADVLWLRTMALKEQGKYFEHMQLSDWICKLEPRFPSVWIFRAWDMAYNISVELPTAEERWRWVNNGIKLLRDEGLKYNPNSSELYKELAWLFLHKIGGQSDDMHWYYKKMLFEQMNELVGVPEADLQALAETPQKAEDLLRDEKVHTLVSEFQNTGVDLLESFFSLLKEDPSLPAAARDLFRKMREDTALKHIERYCRAQRLRAEWKMEPREMSALQQEFGPLDWRLSATHALYWINKGRIYAPEEDTINYDRIAYFSMQDIVYGGKFNIVEHEGTKLYLTSPDYRFIDALEHLFEKDIEYYKKLHQDQSIQDAYNSFLDNLIWIAYFSGQVDKAAKYYQKRFPDKQISPQGLNAFIQERIKEKINNAGREDALRSIEALLEQAWFSYSLADDNNAAFQEKQALFIYRIYTEAQAGQERTALPPFKAIKNDVLEKILNKQYLLTPFSDILIENLKARLQSSKNILQ